MAEAVVRVGLWNWRHGLPLPAARITTRGYPGGPARFGWWRARANARSEDVERALRRGLAEALSRFGSDGDGPAPEQFWIDAMEVPHLQPVDLDEEWRTDVEIDDRRGGRPDNPGRPGAE